MTHPLYFRTKTGFGVFLCLILVLSHLRSTGQACNFGDLYINSTVYLAESFTNNSAANFLNNGSLQLSGDFTNDQPNMAAGTASSSGTILFSSSTLQKIAGTAPSAFYNLSVNNTSATGLTLYKDVTVGSNLDLDYGLINTLSSPPSGSGYGTNALGLLVLGTAAFVSGSVGSDGKGGNINTMVNGRMGKQFDVANTEFNFPIGKRSPSAAYRPPGIVPTSTDGISTFYAEYFPFAHPLPSTLLGPTLFGIIKPEYWQIDRETGKTTKARVKVPYVNPGPGNWMLNNNASATDPCYNCNVAVAHKNDAFVWYLTKASGYYSTGPPFYETRSYADNGEIYTGELSSFSPFSVGYSYNGILPISNTLVAFDGQIAAVDALLKWSVSSHDKLQKFVLEHSRNGQDFTPMASIHPAGNNYQYTHKALPDGANYYRIILEDKDGTRKYSKTIFLMMGVPVTTIIGLQTNPVHNKAVIETYSAKMQNLHIRVLNSLGQLMLQQNNVLQKGSNYLQINTGTLPDGFYHISVISGDGVVASLKMVKE